MNKRLGGRARLSLAIVVFTAIGSSAADAAVSAPSTQASSDLVSQAPEDPQSIALEALQSRGNGLDLAPGQTDDLVVTDSVSTDHNGLTNVYVQQRHNGIDVFGAVGNVAVAPEGSVLRANDRFVSTRGAPPAPRINAIQAARAAAEALGLVPTSPFRVVDTAVGPDRSQTLSDGGISRSDIPARLVYQPTVERGAPRLAWELTIEELGGRNWWQIRIDASTGVELDRNNLVVSDGFAEPTEHPTGHGELDGRIATGMLEQATPAQLAGLVADGSSYEVFAQPLEAPSFGPRSTVAQPADASASPFGWHDTNGVAGADYTVTRGNNVSAYTDIDNDNAVDAGSQPDGGAGLDFSFPLDLTQDPSTYRPAAVTNLFYWNNIAHDFLYSYGFDETAGNFQSNNYGKGGAGNDAVLAEAQDGAALAAVCNATKCTRNNANFATPADGTPGRMQMYVWDAANPDRDGDLDSGIVLHEYGHGLSVRLTGGPSNVTCLNNAEQAGEGWSDYIALVGTMRSTDTAAQRRGIGTLRTGAAHHGDRNPRLPLQHRHDDRPPHVRRDQDGVGAAWRRLDVHGHVVGDDLGADRPVRVRSRSRQRVGWQQHRHPAGRRRPEAAAVFAGLRRCPRRDPDSRRRQQRRCEQLHHLESVRQAGPRLQR